MANSFLNYLGYLLVYFIRLLWDSIVSGLSDYGFDDKSVVGSDIKLNFEYVLFRCPPPPLGYLPISDLNGWVDLCWNLHR